MLRKKIDRYIGWSFLSRFLGVVVLLSVLYVTFDLMKRLEEIQQAGLANATATVATYYAYMISLFVADILPALVLVAAGMVMVHMARRRELLALKASGTSLYRATAPVFFWTLLLCVLVFGFRESIGPRLAKRRETLDRALDNDVERQLLLEDAGFNRYLAVGQYNFADQNMQDVCLLEFRLDDELLLERVVQADRASWGSREGTLVLEAVEVKLLDETGSREDPSFHPTLEVRTGLTPFAFVEAAQEEDDEIGLMHTLSELRRLARTQPDIPHFRVLLHGRLASLFSPFVLLLIGLPCLVGFEHSVGSRFLSVTISILLAAGFYTVSFVLTSMGETQVVPPVLAAWMPTIGAGAAGLWLFESMRT
ncbi:MAG: LptF/LptG family permease [Candidatus Brocadiia bacterium]